MKYDEERNELRPVWGKTQLVTVEKNSTCKAILDKALIKRKAHNRHFAQLCDGKQDFQLLLPDGSDALFLPGGKRDLFYLEAYKKDLGKPYGRITLYLCSITDKELEETVNIFGNSEDDVEVIDVEDAEVKPVIIDASEPRSTETSTIDDRIPDRDMEASMSTVPVGSQKELRCPICCGFFPSDLIEGHADLCPESKHVQAFIDIFGGSNDDIVLEVASDTPPTILPNDLPEDTATTQKDTHQILKDLTSNLGPISRVNVRRGRLFEDYMDSRRKCSWHKPENSLKVTFIGEPAVDTGGPRREFLTGQFGNNFKLKTIYLNICSVKFYLFRCI